MTLQSWIILGLIVLGYITERGQFFSARTREIIRVLVRAVNDPASAKQTVKDSPVKDSLPINRELDVVEPRTIGALGSAPRVSVGRRIGGLLVGLIPGVSRIGAITKAFF